MESSELVAAMDNLIYARVEVRLVGSPEAITAANQLLDGSRAFLIALERDNGSIKGLFTKAAEIGMDEREKMNQSHETSSM
jgi:hypothetical protein